MKKLLVRAGKLGPALLLLMYANCKGEKTEPAVATTLDANSASSISGVAGTAVSPAPSVIVRDQNGSPMGGAAVTFAVVSGGGSVTGATATTDSSGVATVGAWTLGTTAGANVLTASVGSLTATFNATGAAGAAASLTKSAGDGQVAAAGSTVPVAPSVIVRDANGNVKSDDVVTFAVGAGGGSVTGGTATSNASGVATVGSWTLGTTTGANVLTASLGSLTVTFNATGAAGAAASLTKSAGDGQVATAGSTVPVAPSVIVRDANGNLKSDVVVSFAVGVGGGSVTGGTATSNAAGVATVGSWMLGPNSGTNSLVASAAGVPSVTFNAIATTAECNVRTNHAFGTTTSGTLSTADCQFSDGSFVDFLTTTVSAAGAYFFRQAAAFDAYLLLAFPDGTTIAENDDETETGTNSGIKALLPAGSYLLGPGSFDPGVTGDYTISTSTASTNVGNCELVFAVKGVSTDQNIEATDCLWTTPPAAPIYADQIFIFLRAGQSVTLNMTSSTVDSYLELVRVDGLSVAQNDNKDATTKDAQITYTAVQTDYYAIFPRTGVASQTGAYTLTIQ
ncbi:MAG: hypothetical protein M3O61_04980 [Gemmatimonadota bacterium]|nr:hypothetical protein [Gemmatimonadota bacterium]